MSEWASLVFPNSRRTASSHHPLLHAALRIQSLTRSSWPSRSLRVRPLILDDWGREPLQAGARRDLYEILEERVPSTLFCSGPCQSLSKNWQCPGGLLQRVTPVIDTGILLLLKLKKRTALVRELKAVFRRYRSQPIERVINLIKFGATRMGELLRGWALQRVLQLHQGLGGEEGQAPAGACSEAKGLRLGTKRI
jgi:hypothetical protein